MMGRAMFQFLIGHGEICEQSRVYYVIECLLSHESSIRLCISFGDSTRIMNENCHASVEYVFINCDTNWAIYTYNKIISLFYNSF